MIRLLVVSAVAIIAWDIVEALLPRDLFRPEWLQWTKYAIYAAFGFILVRRGSAAAKAMAAVGWTALADVCVGWLVAARIAFGPFTQAPEPEPMSTAGSMVVVHLSLQGQLMMLDPPAVLIARAVVLYSAIGALGIVIGRFAPSIRRT